MCWSQTIPANSTGRQGELLTVCHESPRQRVIRDNHFCTAQLEDYS